MLAFFRKKRQKSFIVFARYSHCLSTIFITLIYSAISFSSNLEYMV